MLQVPSSSNGADDNAMMVMTTKTTFDECRESRDPLLLADDVVADVSIGLTARLLVLTIKVLEDPGNWSQQCPD